MQRASSALGAIAHKAPQTAITTKISHQAIRAASTQATSIEKSEESKVTKVDDVPAEQSQTKKKTVAELDEELKLKMQGLAGDGGEAGVDYEDGKPVAMKRSVKENMFRVI